MKRFGLILSIAILLATQAFPDQLSGKQIFQKWMEAERTAKYIAHEVTILQGYGGLKSRQTIYHNGIIGSRIEYTYPKKLKGIVLTDNGEKSIFYSPEMKKMTIGPSRLEMMKNYTGDKDSFWKHMDIAIAGSETIAGRSAYIITSKFKFDQKKYGKTWIDKKKWVRLKSQEVASDGKILSSSYYTNIEFVKSISSSRFEIAAKPGIKVEQMGNPWLIPLENAKKSVNFKVMVPSYVPKGYTQSGAVLVPFRKRNILGIRYSNGTNDFTIFESSDEILEPKFARKLHEGPIKSGNEMYTRRINGVSITIVGKINPSEMSKIANSMK